MAKDEIHEPDTYNATTWCFARLAVLTMEYGCQEDMMFCGIFDGHGQWGHFVAKRVRESMPFSPLCNWQKALVEASLDPDLDLESDKRRCYKLHISMNRDIRSSGTG
ncbi:hypothetical protein RJ639_029737 [Escallonia herrerae]|uniref:PPM-type phosphatase domain-containing protein n=1 Tax=Escallonia herrerae TaxID=1293975 RepID=A0AA88WZH4_9ASTE|nr:hypothetical protein RJ639_029737 [Escallonia herrerae]